jgi:hypothetical protein
MREIKFRAWSNERRCYEYNVGLNDGKPVRKGYQWFNTDNDVYNAKPEQFTNLYDKNGREIYEGDIISVEGCVGHIIYNDSHCAFLVLGKAWGCGCERLGGMSSLEIEVIGNIHENPELLK